ncbi:caffeine-induced death protein 2-domain-containing protein [Gautieria morchelliformis]|nr:caffeine-induced death protein 2-domain-containing protein [Gautieria morchelliformis]
MPRTPPLGSQALPSPQIVQVTESTCHNLTVFKDLMKEYRKLDDSVTMRLNRTLAQFRDRDRVGPGSGATGMQDEMCAYFWNQLVAGWKARTEIVQYCVNVVDSGMEQKRAALEAQDTSMDEQTRRRRRDAALYAEEVKRNHIHNELTVERIVRLRSLEAFRSRCKYFEPPRTDAEARKWWDTALSGQ